MAQGNGGRHALAVLAMMAGSGCAAGPGYGVIDSTESLCAGQYREYRDGPPVPSGLSREERESYEERTRNYHVSQQCQEAAAQTVRHATLEVPKPRAR